MTHQPPTNLPQQVPPATSGLAIASMICGIVSFFVWIIGSLAAIICGHIALSKIKKSGNQLQGKGMALAGVICGYLTLAIGVTVLTVAIVTPFMMHKQAKERATTDTQNAIEIHRLLKEYERDHGQFPATLSELVDKKYASSISHLQPQRGGNWNYYVGQSTKSPGDNLLLLAPDSDVALYINGSTERLSSYSNYMHAISNMRDYTSVQE